jgi:hypothetical protein
MDKLLQPGQTIEPTKGKGVIKTCTFVMTVFAGLSNDIKGYEYYFRYGKKTKKIKHAELKAMLTANWKVGTLSLT